MKRLLIGSFATLAVCLTCVSGAPVVRADTELIGLSRGEVLVRIGAPATRHRVEAPSEGETAEWWLYRGMAVGFGPDGAVRTVDGERAAGR